jgi:hypothetical protein
VERATKTAIGLQDRSVQYVKERKKNEGRAEEVEKRERVLRVATEWEDRDEGECMGKG